MKNTLLFTKAISRKLVFIMAAFIMFSFSANAQLEEKLSLNAAIGGILPIGGTDYYNPDFQEITPYIFPNFYPGASFMGGIQYNFNRRLSLEGRLYTFYLWYWKYYLRGSEWNSVSLDYWHLGIGVAPKFYLRPGKKANPYGFAEVNVSFNNINAIKTIQNGPDENVDIIQQEMAIGAYVGAGLDLNIVSSFGIFVQSGYYISLLGSAIEENDLKSEHLKAIRGEVGLKLNLFKSKQL